MSVEQILLAVLARAEDPNSGARQMPNHWGWAERGVITGSSPIATQLPHAAGIAYAAQLRREDKVVVSYFGEGAASKGDFHEALRSEEHTSELQSLMRISYAVFCLQKKT